MGEMGLNPAQKLVREKENFLTVAVATAGGVNVYTLDTHDVCGVQVRLYLAPIYSPYLTPYIAVYLGYPRRMRRAGASLSRPYI